ncbi:multiple epidermal growth factor-like domains protein 11 isoform X1 [Haliotis rubra]|uniref:multiple epidermal growth factor-like domains protein 11 isoform X1 n=1 Tax=Haliotis rubra TaxID=36100 RepID=UPI001EE5B1EF|nr:multiple epidermal growth factor-like domains protein 11 isoform X1 [Haliotis rubra]XP_046562717.1 multiple epidermal growth factor-like domains protein 11 isoform X1 [Haliotis rubra]
MSSLRHWIFGTIVSLCCLTVHGREECEPGKYGDGCSRNCSQGCKAFPNNEVLCHKETGTCFEGCNAGVYGDRCDQQCSRNCKEYTCIQQNGHCVLGCIENHIGDFCETYQQTTVVHQGTTYSSHTTVSTGVAPTSSSQVVIPVVVTVLVLILILVGAGVIFIWRRKKERKKRARDSEVRQSCLEVASQERRHLHKRLFIVLSTKAEFFRTSFWMRYYTEGVCFCWNYIPDPIHMRPGH